MTVVDHPDPPDEASAPDRALLLDRGARAALLVFVVVVVGAVPLYLWAGREQWFFLDEWDFLAGREAGSASDLLRPHNEHWSTVPILLYRSVWNVVGLRAYWPYQLLALANHLAIAVLLRVVMRRASVGPWIATASAGAFVLFGAGAQNILWGFQVQFASPITFGLLHLLAADHDGPIDRRDWLGLVAGLAALSSSGIGVVMVVAVGLATLLRRGWRAAAFHTAPLAGIYVVWWLTNGRDALQPFHSTVRQIIEFVGDVYRATFGSLSAISALGLLLVVVLAVGVVVGWRDLGTSDARRRLGVPLGLLVAGALFTVVTGYGRAYVRADAGETSRYLHVTAALALPALAVAIEGLYRRWRAVGIAAVALLLAGVPGNIRSTIDYAEENPSILGNRATVLALGSLPEGMAAPPELRPLGPAGVELTMGWLQAGVREGTIPTLDAVDTLTTQRVAWMLSFVQTEEPIDSTNCQRMGRPITRDLVPGDEILLESGKLQIANAARPGLGPLSFNADFGGTIRAREQLTVELRSTSLLDGAVLCS